MVAGRRGGSRCGYIGADVRPDWRASRCYPFRCKRRRRRQRPASIHDLRPADEVTLFQIKPVRSAADLEATVQLFNAYESGVGVDLGNQDFATELATLPGKYATP